MLHSQKIVYYSGRITWRPGWERAREHTHHSIYVCTIREISFAESITRTLTFVHRPTTAAVTVAAANINISAKNHAFFPSKRRDVSNLVADGYKTYTNMRIDRHMHTGCLNWTLKLTLGPHLLSLSCVCVCVFADVAVASPLLRDTGAKYMENTFIATTIYFDCLTHRQTGRTNNKKLSHFPCSNVNGLLPLGTQHSQCERFYIVFNQQTDALYCDCYCYCCCCSLAPQPLFIRICVTVCAQHIT